MTRMLLGIAAGVTLLSINLACQTMPSLEVASFWAAKGPTGRPTEIAAIWQDGVDVKLDGQNGGFPTPGFAGRIFFMQAREGMPGQTVLVNGTLKVLLYDDKPSQGPPQPLETWTILPEHMSLLIKKDLTGWGYSVWLPWNTYDQSIRNVRMIVEYTEKDGTKIPPSEPMMIQILDANKHGKPVLETRQVQNKTWLPQQ